MLPPRFKDLDDLNNHLDHEGLDDEMDILGEDDLETLRIPTVPGVENPQKLKRGRKMRKAS